MNENRLASRPARRAWTTDEVRSLGTRTDLVTACQVVFGVGKNKAWELFHTGELPFPALRVGRRVVVPVAPLLELLGISPETNAAGVPHTPASASNVHQTRKVGDTSDGNTHRHPAA